MNEIEDRLERRLERLLMEPCQPQWYNDLGIFFFELEETALAAMYFRRGYQLMKEGQKLGSASEELELLETYGLVLYRLGRYEEAVIIYQEALQLDRDNERILETLGELYYLLGGQKE